MTREEAEKHFRRLYWAKAWAEDTEWELLRHDTTERTPAGPLAWDKVKDMGTESLWGTWVEAHVAEEMRKWDERREDVARAESCARMLAEAAR